MNKKKESHIRKWFFFSVVSSPWKYAFDIICNGLLLLHPASFNQSFFLLSFLCACLHALPSSRVCMSIFSSTLVGSFFAARSYSSEKKPDEISPFLHVPPLTGVCMPCRWFFLFSLVGAMDSFVSLPKTSPTSIAPSRRHFGLSFFRAAAADGDDVVVNRQNTFIYITQSPWIWLLSIFVVLFFFRSCAPIFFLFLPLPPVNIVHVLKSFCTTFKTERWRHQKNPPNSTQNT